MTRHSRTLAGLTLAVLGATTLTGCLVKQEAPPPPYYRTTDTLRNYQHGDWIQYNVIATKSTAVGTEQTNAILKVSWTEPSPATITAPDGETYNVLKKVIAISYVGEDGNVVDTAETVHYVLREDTTQLVAMGHPNLGQYYWMNGTGGILFPPDRADSPSGGQEPISQLTSPLAVGQAYTVEYYLMDECTTQNPGCQLDVGKFTNNLSVDGDSEQINTNLNNYANPFKVSFSGRVIPAAGISPLPLSFDIFDVCSEAQSSHIGNMYIVPEIGVIQLSNRCTDHNATGDVIQYDITIDTTSPGIQ